jgi:hypothetical protein
MLSLLAAALFVMSATACHRRAKPAEGPMERAGKKVDNAAQDTKEEAKDLKNDVKKDVK